MHRRRAKVDDALQLAGDFQSERFQVGRALPSLVRLDRRAIRDAALARVDPRGDERAPVEESEAAHGGDRVKGVQAVEQGAAGMTHCNCNFLPATIARWVRFWPSSVCNAT